MASHSPDLQIIVGVPPEYADAVLDAIASAGGGTIGEYTHCSFTSIGTGRFKPSAAANPAVGEKGEINTVEEVRIETFCNRSVAKAVVAAIRKAHPYEEPVIYLVPLLSLDDL
jgi:hypothetical protein